MSYTVKYKIGRMLLRRRVRGVVADGINEVGSSRWFHLENNTRVEIPTAETRFWFSKERAEVIEANLKAAKEKEPTV